MSIRFYDEDIWPDEVPHVIQGEIERVEVHLPQMTGPFEATLTIRVKGIDSGTFPLLRELSRDTARLLDRPPVTVFLFEDPEV